MDPLSLPPGTLRPVGSLDIGRRRRCGGRGNRVSALPAEKRALLIGTDLRAYLWTLLSRADTLRNVGWFDERLPRLQDLDFFLRFALKGGRIVAPETNEALCIYHKTDLGRSATRRARATTSSPNAAPAVP